MNIRLETWLSGISVVLSSISRVSPCFLIGPWEQPRGYTVPHVTASRPEGQRYPATCPRSVSVLETESGSSASQTCGFPPGDPKFSYWWVRAETSSSIGCRHVGSHCAAGLPTAPRMWNVRASSTRGGEPEQRVILRVSVFFNELSPCCGWRSGDWIRGLTG